MMVMMMMMMMMMICCQQTDAEKDVDKEEDDILQKKLDYDKKFSEIENEYVETFPGSWTCFYMWNEINKHLIWLSTGSN